MGENAAGGFSWGWVIFIVLILWFFVGGGLGMNRNVGEAAAVGCSRVSNCEIEKQEIIDSARNFWQIGNTASTTQAVVVGDGEKTRTKIDFYEYQNLRDQLAQERTKNVVLENRVYSDAQFNSLSRQNEGMFCALKGEIADLSCQVPKRPPYYAQGFICGGNRIPPDGCGGC